MTATVRSSGRRERQPRQAIPHRAAVMIAFLLFTILAVIFWPVALVIALGWFGLLVLRICFGITVFGVKAAAATGIAAKMLHDSMRGWRPRPGNY
jgi:nitrate reductase NapE component